MRTALLCVALLVPACGGGGGSDGSPVVPRGSRVLGMHVGEATGESYDAAMDAAQAAGATAATLSLNWDTLETAPGVYDPTLLDIANAYYPARGTSIFLAIRPIDTNGKHFPADIASLPYDHPTAIARLEALLDWIFTRIPALAVPIMAVGNEVDAPIGTNATLWAQWKTMFDAAVTRIHVLRPGVQVGMVARFEGALDPLYASACANADAVLVTYYPLNPGFTVKDPGVVGADFASLAASTAKPVHVVEAGYPSSATCASSDELQRQFVAALFAAWDANASRIPSVYYSILTDYSASEMATFATYYGSSDPPFLEFIRTLGLRTDGAAAKPAHTEFDAQASARGW